MKQPVFSTRVLHWWDRHGRKDLPWQHPRTLYRVWVSEIMLQQTQVKTVIPYFDHFVERFPDIRTLAAASLDEVLAAWSGLGYYARARNLHQTAICCLQENGAELPDTPRALAALPGIGQSTANAIYSQAMDQPAVILDGNVKRVLARHRLIDGWPGKAEVHRQLWATAKHYLPTTRGAHYSQAIMDLGATVCKRSKPTCDRCPVKDDCGALLEGTVSAYPAPNPRTRISKKILNMIILTDEEERVLLERRPPTGIWGGLWTLPTDESLETVTQSLGLNADDLQTLPVMQHRLTHILMTIQASIAQKKPSADHVECNRDQQWFGQHEWPRLGLPKPVRDLLEAQLDKDQRKTANG